MTFTCKHDLHLHTSLSACCHDEALTPQRVAAFAQEAAYDMLCVTDHLWSRDVPGASEWYAPQDVRHVMRALPLPSTRDIPFYFGCETEYLGADRLGMTRADMDRFDFVVVPLNHFHMVGFVRPAEVTDAKGIARLVIRRLEELTALPLPFGKIGIAHLTCPLMFPEGGIADVLMEIDADAAARALARLARLGGAVELNAGAFAGWEKAPEAYLRLYALARDAGCRFYCASDAHTVAALARVGEVLPPVVQALGLTDAQRYRITR